MYVVPVGICWLVVGKKEKPTVMVPVGIVVGRGKKEKTHCMLNASQVASHLRVSKTFSFIRIILSEIKKLCSLI